MGGEGSMAAPQDHAGRLAVDFGTSNTLLAVWDPERGEGIPFEIAQYSRKYRQGDEEVPVVPSVINYGPDGTRWIGNQVLERGLYDSPHTFRWLKTYITRRNPGKKRIGTRSVSHFEAGRDFLSAILVFASEDAGFTEEEIALTVPVEAFEGYEDWLAGVAEAAGKSRFRLIDEASAAALGYGAHIQPNDVYLVFDFGGGSLDVAVVLVEREEELRGFRRCRVLGKAGADLGGATVDGWLFEELLRRSGRSDADEAVRRASCKLLAECEKAKERLSLEREAHIEGADPVTGISLSATLTREEFEELLEEREFYTDIDRTVRRALADARERGYREEAIKAVLMVGGCSQIPSVRSQLRRIFGADRVLAHRPLDAVARGAAAFAAGVDFYDYIQHDYALRYVDRTSGGYRYYPLVKRGTPYPTAEPVARLTIKAAFDGQRELGLVVFEVNEDRRWGKGRLVEIEFDPSGAARVARLTPEEKDHRRYFQIGSPTFLKADPPAQRGEGRFEVLFTIDGNKRLLVSARDMRTGKWVYRDLPLVKLT